VIIVYSAGNIAMWRLYSRTYRKEYRRFTHLVVPIISTVILLYVGYKTVSPLPTGVNKWAPLVAVAWVVAGLVVVLVLSKTGRHTWMTRAGEAVAGSEDPLDVPVTTPKDTKDLQFVTKEPDHA
jgi:amino acid transporter